MLNMTTFSLKQLENRPKYILGYSGINGYLSFKNIHIEDLNEHERHVSQGMDSAASIIKNGEIVAACAEERFINQKHTNLFPVNSIKACLEMAGITIDEVSLIAHNFNYEPYQRLLSLNHYTKELFEQVLSKKAQSKLFSEHFGINVSDKFYCCDHHETHAAYVFETSGFANSLIVVIDGLGEFDSISIYQGNHDVGLTLLKSYGPSSSIGMLYSAVTEYLGYTSNSDEYKIMGLSAYGDSSRYRHIFDQIINYKDGGLEIHHLIPPEINKVADRETYRYFKNWLAQQIFPARLSDDPIEIEHKDFAAALQYKLNEALTYIVNFWQQETGEINLCLAGGVALNCVANSYIAKEKLFKEIYIAPASGDDGTSIGAAMVLMRRNGFKLSRTHYKEMPFYGPKIKFTKKNQINNKNLIVEKINNDSLIEIVTAEILRGKIIAWTEGGMEFGPRALGHRSILADPRRYEMRQRINTVTKRREDFRPFAPIVKQERVNDFFNVVEGASYKHMLFNATVKEEYRKSLQAVTHIDGSARVQTIFKSELPNLWKLLDRVEQKIEMPILLNTSYNLHSMPIVSNDVVAIDAFVHSDIDLLIINNVIIRKKA